MEMGCRCKLVWEGLRKLTRSEMRMPRRSDSGKLKRSGSLILRPMGKHWDFDATMPRLTRRARNSERPKRRRTAMRINLLKLIRTDWMKWRPTGTRKSKPRGTPMEKPTQKHRPRQP